MARRTRVLWVVTVALLAAAAFAPAASAQSGVQKVDIDLVFTQLEPDDSTDPITTPGGYFTMSGDGAVCDGGSFYDEFVNAELDTDGFQTYVHIRDWKVFTCNNGETFTLDMYVEFELDFSQAGDPFNLVYSTWTVSDSSIEGLTGTGAIEYRNWELAQPEETWSGVFGVFECRKGGWESLTDAFGTPFKNQGDCISYFATDGRNLAAG